MTKTATDTRFAIVRLIVVLGVFIGFVVTGRLGGLADWSSTAKGTANVLMLCAIVWGFYMLYKDLKYFFRWE